MFRTLVLLVVVTFAIPVLAQQEAKEQVEPHPEWQWLDEIHDNLSSSVNQSVNWFDQFFADQHSEQQQSAQAVTKVTLGWEPRAGTLNEFSGHFRVRVKLPNLKEQVDLILSDYDEEQQQHSLEAARNPVFARDEEINLALRWSSLGQKKHKFSGRIGIGKRAQLFTKLRYEHNFNLTDKHNIRFEPSLYYYHRDGAGARFQVNYEQSLANDKLFRFGNALIYRDKQQDWVTQHGVYYYNQQTEKQALIYGFYTEATSKPNFQASEYLLSLRIRRNVLREWLFLEIEPFALWRRDEGWDTSPGVAIRFQGYFSQ